MTKWFEPHAIDQRKSPGRCRGFSFHPLEIGSVSRADRALAPIAELVVHAHPHDVELLVHARRKTGEERKLEVLMTEVDMEVLELEAPIIGDGVLDADAGRPSGLS